MLVNQTFLYENGSSRYRYLVVIEDRTFFTNEETPLCKKYDKVQICQMIGFLIDNIYIKIGNQLFRQPSSTMHWYPNMRWVGTSCALLLANLFLYSYEVEFLRSVKKSNKKLTKTSNLTFRYILTTSSVSITQGLSTSSKISTHRNLWFQRYLNREMLCRT